MSSGSSHWDEVYGSKADGELSWHQAEPVVSLQLIRPLLFPGVRVIDVGGGSSVLAGRLLDLGVAELAVLDLSQAALERSRAQLEARGAAVRWIVADVTAAEAPGSFDIWHDRAVFHFLTDAADRRSYAALAERSVVPGGHLVMATFAPDGPERCSGLPVARYDAAALAQALGPGFALQRSLPETHVTPWGRAQQFSYAVLRRVGSL